MKSTPFSGLFLLCATLLVVAPALAQQWKWRDSNGRVTVSDLPPPREVADKDILQRPDAAARAARQAANVAAAAASAPPGTTPGAAPGTAPAATPKPVDKELEARKRAAEAERQAKAKADEEKLAAQRAENCQRARAQIATLESGQRVARVNEKGEREFLDDATRAAEVRRAREVQASECR
jgi:hypothetical protein